MSESQGAAPPFKPLDLWAPYFFFANVLSRALCDELIAIGESFPAQSGSVSDTSVDTKIRNSEIHWMPLNPTSGKAYQIVHDCIRAANERVWRMELGAFHDPLQYTVYGVSGAHYDWHMDIGQGWVSTRKLSASVQLSPAEDYDGGDLQFFNDGRGGPNPDATPLRQQGTVVVFPAYMMHRVTPITRGVRRCMIGWMAGPPYR